jgi:hypothetical protein
MMRQGSPVTKEWERLKALNSPARARQFETFVGTLFGRAHFDVTLSPGAGGSRQVDLMATMGDEAYLVEAKWWTKKKPGEPEIADLEDRLKNTAPSVIGVLVSHSGFAKPAIDRVERRAERPILLVTGEELEDAIGWGDRDFLRMLHQKRDAMRVHSKAVFLPRRAPRRSGHRKNVLPSSPETIVMRDGGRAKWMTCGGDFGQFTFVRELPDIDWVAGSGFGVSLDVHASVSDEAGLLNLLRELSAKGWITDQSRWSIQQAETTWHGAGADTFAQQLAAWKNRYEGVRTLHHTEEFSYIDVIDDLGFFSLTGQIAAHEPRFVWRTSLSFQLSGIPVDVGALRALCDRFDVPSRLFFRPRNAESVSRTHLGPSDRVVLDVVGFIVEGDEWESDFDDGEWAVGVVAKNPFRSRKEHPGWWPDIAADSEFIICALRSHHLLGAPKATYRLWTCESAWTSDALVVRPVADWDDDEAVDETVPGSRRRARPPQSVVTE